MLKDTPCRLLGRGIVMLTTVPWDNTMISVIIMLKYDAVLFDLDGTLSESAPGIRKSIEMTLTELGRPIPDLSDYTKYVGPPLDRTLTGMCGMSREEAMAALPIYRRNYDIYGTPSNRLFDGLTEVLTELRAKGVKLAVCTSKNERLAGRVTDRLGVTDHMDAICGSRDDGGRKDKNELIPYALHRLGDVSADRAVMVGDTRFDTVGAVQSGVDFVGVLYGYGTRQSMEDSGATVFAETPDELLDLLL